MDRYYFLRRIRGPILLLTFGVTAILNQWHILSFGRSWPLYLIVLGLLGLAERFTLAESAALPPRPPVDVSQPPYQNGESR